MSVSQYIQEQFSYQYSFRGWLVLILAGFVLAFRAMACLGMVFLNFQKR